MRQLRGGVNFGLAILILFVCSVCSECAVCIGAVCWRHELVVGVLFIGDPPATGVMARLICSRVTPCDGTSKHRVPSGPFPDHSPESTTERDNRANIAICTPWHFIVHEFDRSLRPIRAPHISHSSRDPQPDDNDPPFAAARCDAVLDIRRHR
jgi:hypothetical protein